MSDRFALHATQEEVETVLDVSTERDHYFDPDYNIIPGTLVPAVVPGNSNREVHNFQWGLIPEEAESDEEGKDHYVTPSEELAGDDWLNECFKKRRCLVPANGFYKWKSAEREASPFYIRLLSNEVMAFGGIYSVWKSESGRDVYSFSLLTTDANALVQPVDDRMPVIIQREDYGKWLGEKEVDMDTLEECLRPYDLTEMVVNRVSEKVNELTNNGPELIQPIPK